MPDTATGEVTTNTDSFKAARDAYVALRWKQRKDIVDAFLASDFLPSGSDSATESPEKPRVIMGGGRGRSNYTSKRTIAPYNLNNWMWVETFMGNTTVLVTLQSPDTDPQSGNSHALMDRVGILVYPTDPKLHTDGFAERTIISTPYDLPLSTKDLQSLVTLVTAQLRRSEASTSTK